MRKWTDLARSFESESSVPVQLAQLAQIAQPQERYSGADTLLSMANCTNCINCTPPCQCDWEERAAIAEFDGELSREEAERLANQSLGPRSPVSMP